MAATEAGFEEVVGAVLRLCAARPRVSSLLVAVSGIDGSGKSATASRWAAALTEAGQRVASLGTDAWHYPKSIRFTATEPAANFYRNGLRFEAMFDLLVEPLRWRRSIALSAPLIDPVTDAWYPGSFAFENVDVILLEGIFLLRPTWRSRYDLAVWIDCPFETALARALARNQEGISREALEADYRRIYFPAQRLHMAADRPSELADLIYRNG
jgi:uridine kinase